MLVTMLAGLNSGLSWIPLFATLFVCQLMHRRLFLHIRLPMALGHLLKAVHTGQDLPVRIICAVACHLLLAMRRSSPMLHRAVLPHTNCGIIVLPGTG